MGLITFYCVSVQLSRKKPNENNCMKGLEQVILGGFALSKDTAMLSDFIRHTN